RGDPAQPTKFRSPDEASTRDETMAGAARSPAPAAEALRKRRRLRMEDRVNSVLPDCGFIRGRIIPAPPGLGPPGCRAGRKAEGGGAGRAPVVRSLRLPPVILSIHLDGTVCR